MAKVLFIAEVVIPVFFIIGLGYFLNRIGVIHDRFRTDLSKLVFYVALPVLLFTNISKTDLFVSLDGRLIGFSILAVTICFLLSFGIILGLPIKSSHKGPFIQGAYRCNLAYVGIPITMNAFGDAVLPVVGLFIAFVAPVFNLFAVFALTFPYDSYKSRNRSKPVGDIIRGFATLGKGLLENPIIISCIAGVLVSLTAHRWGGVQYPSLMEDSLRLLTQVTVPLALISVGAGLRFTHIRDGLLLTSVAVMVKLIVMPLLALFIFNLFHLSEESSALGTVLLAAPTATASYIMTKVIGGDDGFSANIVVVTHVMSIVTLPVWLYILA